MAWCFGPPHGGGQGDAATGSRGWRVSCAAGGVAMRRALRRSGALPRSGAYGAGEGAGVGGGGVGGWVGKTSGGCPGIGAPGRG
jgi:hypothetical protein